MGFIHKDIKMLFPYCRLKSLNISRNLIGDAGIVCISDNLKSPQYYVNPALEKLDVSGTKMSDEGFLYLLQSIGFVPTLWQAVI